MPLFLDDFSFLAQGGLGDPIIFSCEFWRLNSQQPSIAPERANLKAHLKSPKYRNSLLEENTKKFETQLPGLSVTRHKKESSGTGTLSPKP